MHAIRLDLISSIFHAISQIKTESFLNFTEYTNKLLKHHFE